MADRQRPGRGLGAGRKQFDRRTVVDDVDAPVGADGLVLALRRRRNHGDVVAAARDPRERAPGKPLDPVRENRRHPAGQQLVEAFVHVEMNRDFQLAADEQSPQRGFRFVRRQEVGRAGTRAPPTGMEGLDLRQTRTPRCAPGHGTDGFQPEARMLRRRLFGIVSSQNEHLMSGLGERQRLPAHHPLIAQRVRRTHDRNAHSLFPHDVRRPSSSFRRA